MTDFNGFRDASNDLEVGTVVQLMGGSSCMTVIDCDELGVRCAWHDDQARPEFATYPVEALCVVVCDECDSDNADDSDVPEVKN